MGVGKTHQVYICCFGVRLRRHKSSSLHNLVVWVGEIPCKRGDTAQGLNGGGKKGGWTLVGGGMGQVNRHKKRLTGTTRGRGETKKFPGWHGPRRMVASGSRLHKGGRWFWTTRAPKQE